MLWPVSTCGHGFLACASGAWSRTEAVMCMSLPLATPEQSGGLHFDPQCQPISTSAPATARVGCVGRLRRVFPWPKPTGTTSIQRADGLQDSAIHTKAFAYIHTRAHAHDFFLEFSLYLLYLSKMLMFHYR